MRAFPLKPLTVMANEYLELYRSLPRRAQPVRGDEERKSLFRLCAGPWDKTCPFG